MPVSLRQQIHYRGDIKGVLLLKNSERAFVRKSPGFTHRHEMKESQKEVSGRLTKPKKSFRICKYPREEPRRVSYETHFFREYACQSEQKSNLGQNLTSNDLIPLDSGSPASRTKRIRFGLFLLFDHI
jgi:hypothetical protein